MCGSLSGVQGASWVGDAIGSLAQARGLLPWPAQSLPHSQEVPGCTSRGTQQHSHIYAVCRIPQSHELVLQWFAPNRHFWFLAKQCPWVRTVSLHLWPWHLLNDHGIHTCDCCVCLTPATKKIKLVVVIYDHTLFIMSFYNLPISLLS